VAAQEAASRLVLASQSPRRRELLALLGVDFEVSPANVDESPTASELPEDYVIRVATNKARALVLAARQAILAADTAVVLDGELLGKPATAEGARSMLQRLSGRPHTVHSGVVLRDAGGCRVCRVATTVRFRDLSAGEIAAYVDTGEPMDKAGAYGIQGLGGAFVTTIEGSYSNVVGLPLAETLALLRAAGIASALDLPGADA
jgi:septum formation protein